MPSPPGKSASPADGIVPPTDEESVANPTAYNFEEIAPLMTTFKENHEDLTSEASKEILWETHFGTFGMGVSMFRTEDAAQLVLKGIPDR